MNKVTAIYCRESTEKQDIESLIALCQREVKKLKLQNVKVYADVASGYTREREQYNLLKKDIQNNLVETLVLYESSRLTRDEIEHHVFYQLLRVHNVKLYTVTHGWIDLHNEDDTFLTNLLNLLDAREGRKTAKRSKDRMIELAKQGRWTGGPAPLGYKLENKELIVVPEDAQKVKLIFKLFLEGNTRHSIAKMLGYEIKKVRRILTNPVYIGKLKFHQSEMKNKKRIYNKKYEFLDGIHEAIIDTDTFNLVQMQLKKIYREVSNEKYIFKDLITCVCGRKMYKIKRTDIYFQKRSNKEVEYTKNLYSCMSSNKSKIQCSLNSLHEDELFIEVMEELKKIIYSLDVDTISTEVEDYNNQLKFLKKELSTLITKKETLTRQLINSLITEALFEKLMLELKEKEIFLREQIKNLETIINSKELKESNNAILKEYFEKLQAEKDPQKLNNFFKLIIEEIEMINDYRFYIHLRF